MFYPFNRHVLVKTLGDDTPQTESGILLPEDYVPKSAYEVVEYLDAASDCQISKLQQPPERLIVQSSMIEEIETGGETYKVVLENHIVGYLRD